ncbi:uncharacterized protein [Setaria viridis]|uniref:uncharacterized protein n=1 Tax=Setaria viridis TaxID=4556 RepID=UPI003B3BAC65
MNCVVKTWLLGVITAKLADAVVEHGANAHAVWLAIESQFLSNHETRALFLNLEFRNLAWRPLRHRLLSSLQGHGGCISDCTLVINVIHGLHERFTTIGLHLRCTRPLPTFLKVRNELILEEITMAKITPATALTASSVAGASKSSPSHQPLKQAGSSTVGNDEQKRCKRGGQKRDGG